MASSLDMALDDLIKKKKSDRSAAASGGASRGRNRSAPYPPPVGKSSESASLYGVYSDHVAVAMPLGILPPPPPLGVPPPPPLSAEVIETGTKLYISNLDPGVTNDDIQELFQVVGELKRHSINYDMNGRSKGTAEVVFARRADAQAAILRYNNVQLDRRPMRIELIGTNVEASPRPLIPSHNLNKQNSARDSAPSSGNGRGPGKWRGGSGGGGSSGASGGRSRRGNRGSGSGKPRAEPVSAADLDAELDRYHAEATKADGQI